MPIALVNIEEALDHLHMRNNDQAAAVQRYIYMASAIVMRHMKLTEIQDTWVDDASPPAESIPYNVRAGTLLILSELWHQRESGVADVMSDAVVALLDRLPTLA